MPYIGPVLAASICRFRNALGGFGAVKQLREVWGLKPEAAERLTPMFRSGIGGLPYHLCGYGYVVRAEESPLHLCYGCQRIQALQTAPPLGFT